MEKYGDSEKVFSLEIAKEGGSLKLSAFDNIIGSEKTIRHHEFHEVDDSEINTLCSDVLELLNRTNQQGKINRTIYDKLKTSGQLLYDALLTTRIKGKLASTQAAHLKISIDNHLVKIPWELLFDGRAFLCQRFSMGRVVSTGQSVLEPTTRLLNKPLKMLIIADPKNDLEGSYSEGLCLRDELDRHRDIVEIQLQSTDVDVNFVKGALREFDIVHYAGHADYDINMPSRSGFLMADGKFMASDIMQMIGSTPFPSLVFSNACKSSHTESWELGGNYEHEIYGLANAFLLAGVQHYIGTFWEVQDEPSRYFSIEFFLALVEGDRIGEAVQKARLRLIERYGEESILWTSYVLYGDPGLRYFESFPSPASSTITKKDEVQEKVFQHETSPITEDLRGQEKIIVFPSKPRKWMMAVGSVLLLAATWGVLTLKTEDRPFRSQTPIEDKSGLEEAKTKRIDALVASLLKDYQKKKEGGGSPNKNAWRSRPVTLTFLNIKAKGLSEEEKNFILSKMAETLRGSGQILVVDREILDKLLEELNLSTSTLAEPGTMLRLGKILSARLISTGSIIRDGEDWLVNLRMIETETTSIRVALAESLKNKDKTDLAEDIALTMIKKIRKAYPLRGALLFSKKGRVLVDIGANEGVVKGLRMEVLSEGAEGMIRLGEIKISSVEAEKSHALITSERGVIREGLRVKELL